MRMTGHLADVAIDDFTLTPECFGLGTLITVMLPSLNLITYQPYAAYKQVYAADSKKPYLHC